MDWDKLFSKVSTKADTATVLIGGAAGFVIDAYSSLHGVISPGYFAGLSASAALGLKSGIEAVLESRKKRKTADRRKRDALKKANLVLKELTGSQWEIAATRLLKDIDLFNKDILSVDQLEATTAECLDSYRRPQTTSTSLSTLGGTTGEPFRK